MALPRWRRGLLAALAFAAASVLGATSPVIAFAADAHGQHSHEAARGGHALPTHEDNDDQGQDDQGQDEQGESAVVITTPTPSPVVHGHRARAAVVSVPTPTPAPTPQPTPAVTPPPASVASTSGVAPALPRIAVAPVAPAAPAAIVVPQLPTVGPAPTPVAAHPRGARDNPAVVGFPDVVLPPGPEGTRLAAALLVLPLLFAIWLWSLVRASTAAWNERSARERALLAHQLGVEPAELAGIGELGLQKLTEQVAFDELTGVARRAAGLAALEREVARARRAGTPLAVAFVDVDGLKAANDTEGHEAGDRLLQAVASVLVGRLRGQDVVFRFGGDEFVCVLPDTAESVAHALLADVRARAERSGIRFSVGVANLKPGESADKLLQRADREQYGDKKARASGRS